MNFAEKAFRQTLYRLLLIQFGLVFGLAVVLYSFFEKTSGYTIALLYGGFVSIVVTLLRAWRLKIATDDTEFADSDTREPEKIKARGSVSALELYKGFALGYIVAILLLAVGLGGLKLVPVALIIGFIAAQLGYFFVRPPRPGAGR